MIKVLGIDPSLNNFGFAVAELEHDGEKWSVKITNLHLHQTEPEKSKQVRKNSSDLERARLLSDAIRLYEPDADLIVAEVPVGSQSARAMASYGICVGLLAQIQKPLIQVTPSQVKIAATGDKLATKEEMIAWAVKTYPTAPWLKQKEKILNKNEHLADAVAAVHAMIKTDDFKLMAGILRR